MLSSVFVQRGDEEDTEQIKKVINVITILGSCNCNANNSPAHPSNPNDDVMILNHDRSLSTATLSMTQSGHQLYEGRQEVNTITSNKELRLCEKITQDSFL